MDKSNAAEQSVKTAPEILTKDMPPLEMDSNVKPAVSQVKEETVTLTKAEADSLFKAAEDATELAKKKSVDAENYKKAALNAKKKLKDVYGDEDEEEKPQTSKEDIMQIVRDAIKEAIPTIVQPKTEEDPLLEANKTISELKIALKNRSQIASSSAGSNLDKQDATSNASNGYWSPQQIEDLKKKGLDPDEVYKNIPKSGQAYTPQV
jgi:hypothetical protein